MKSELLRIVDRISTAGVVVLLLISISLASGIDQAGASGSGRSNSGALFMESITGETLSGRAGDIVSGFPTSTALRYFLPGDADGSGTTDISDAVLLINYIFAGGPAPAPLAAGDANCSGEIDISDAVFLIQYIFGGGIAPNYCS